MKDPDYTLNIFHDVDEESKARGVVFVVQTTKVFVSFRYDILLEPSEEGRTIRLRIKGLHAPELLMPGGGPAIGRCHFTNLFGHYHLIVVKQDKTHNSFDIDVGKKEVTLLRSPQQSFIQVTTDPL